MEWRVGTRVLTVGTAAVCEAEIIEISPSGIYLRVSFNGHDPYWLQREDLNLQVVEVLSPRKEEWSDSLP